MRLSWPFLLITIVFVYTTILNVYEKPDGIKIATWFIFAIVASSVVSRLWCTKEVSDSKAFDSKTRASPAFCGTV